MKKIFYTLIFILFFNNTYAQVEQRGFEPQLRISFDEGIDDFKNFSFGLDALAAYRINEYFRLGVGIGINYVDLLYQNESFYNGYYRRKYKESAMTIPFFADIKVDFLKTKISPYLGFDIGYNLFIPFSKYAEDNKLGLFFRPAMGVDFHFERFTLFVELAYRYQMRKWEKWTPNANYNQITQSIGFQF